MRTKTGIVTSTKMDKTIVVRVISQTTHPKYKKRISTSKKFYAHNPEENVVKEGDKITIYETRPMSKLKRWTTVEPKAKA